VPATDEAVELALTAADAADDRKATDLAILEVADILAVVDLFVLATATSDRQIRAVTDRIDERLREQHDRRPLRREGEPGSGWVLLDYGDIVCHVFGTEQRDYYALDRLWADVPRRDVRSGDRVDAPTPGAGADREVDVVGGRVPNPFDVELTGDDEVDDLAAELDALDEDLADDVATDRDRGGAGVRGAARTDSEAAGDR
jgi:ribosome-associated protein